ncbi:aminoglycoside 6-adenylyltransferase [bacterium]|nr:aminoglycoside 6-adenylyltransferase [bacterium]MBT3581417.1 aminoglycoside 6-adenylyltransferase [bacterium]MBT4552543.1 aminoglycoside 6-adenylyltransferase [bacterium]
MAMIDLPTEDEVLTNFKNWAKHNPLIRAAILTSSRVFPEAKVDFLSDYDIELYVSDMASFEQSDDWLQVFGPIMVRWPREPQSTLEPGWITRLVLFKNKVRMDFQVTAQKTIEPKRYDNGYRVLIDKDQITEDLASPTFTQYLVQKPTAEEFKNLVHDFWWDAIYVAKCLYRDELPFAKFMLDDTLRYNFLHKVLEWYIGFQNDWAVNVGVQGKKFKNFLDRQLWQKYEKTFTGAVIEENWQAFFNLLGLFSKISQNLSTNLGYDYPAELEQEVTQYCREIYES